jgi:hypothetical protein
MRAFTAEVQPTLVPPRERDKPSRHGLGRTTRGASPRSHHTRGRESCWPLRTGPSRSPSCAVALGRAREPHLAAGQPRLRSRRAPRRQRGRPRTKPSPGRLPPPSRVPPATPGRGASAPRLTRRPRTGTSRFWRIASAALLAVTLPCSRRFEPRPDPGYGSSSIRKRPQARSHRCNDRVSIFTPGRDGGARRDRLRCSSFRLFVAPIEEFLE